VDQTQNTVPRFLGLDNSLGAEQKELTTTEFKPKAYACTLVLRNYGLTSPETLKKIAQSFGWPRSRLPPQIYPLTLPYRTRFFQIARANWNAE